MTTKMVIRPLDPRLAAANKRLLANIEAFVEDDHPLLSDTRTLLLLTQNLFWHLRCTNDSGVVQATLVEEEVHFCRGSDGAPLYALSTATPHKHGVTGRSLVVVVVGGVEEADDDHPHPLAQTINNNHAKKEWVIRGGREWIEMRDEMLVALGGWPMYVRTRGLERNRELRGEGVAYYDSFEWPPAMAQHIQIEEDQTRAGLFCEPPLLLPAAPAAPQQQLHRIVDYVYHRLNAEAPQLSLESMAQFLMWKGPLFTSTWTEATTTLRFTHPYWVGGAYHLSTLPTEAHKLLLQLLTSPEPPNAQWIYGWEHDDRGQLDVFQSPEEWAMRCDELWDLKK